METMIAMVVIFGSLTALAYTATVGFRYISYGRDRQQATGYANKIMEEIRGQAYSIITRGMSHLRPDRRRQDRELHVADATGSRAAAGRRSSRRR